MTRHTVSRDLASNSRAGGRPAVSRSSANRATVEMIGVKWHHTRHGDLRARLRAAVVAEGFDSAADWLSAAIERRRAELAPAASVHPLAR